MQRVQLQVRVARGSVTVLIKGLAQIRDRLQRNAANFPSGIGRIQHVDAKHAAALGIQAAPGMTLGEYQAPLSRFLKGNVTGKRMLRDVFHIHPHMAHVAILGSNLPHNSHILTDIRADPRRNLVGVSHSIYDHGGSYHGVMQTILQHHGHKIDIHRDLVAIEPHSQRHNIVHASEDGLDRLARHLAHHHGLPVTQTLHANLDIGGYAWARCGYDFANATNRLMTAQYMHHALESRANGDGLPGHQVRRDHVDEMHRDIDRMAGTGASASEMAALDRPHWDRFWHPDFPNGLHAGKAGMLGSSWFGEKETYP